MAELEAELIEITASEIIDKIRKGEPVVYDHVRIIGDIYNLDLPPRHVDRSESLKKAGGIYEKCKVVSASIEITNSTFNGNVDLCSIFFEASTNFRNTEFSERAFFNGATFSGQANFDDATFRGGLIQWCQIQRGCRLQ